MSEYLPGEYEGLNRVMSEYRSEPGQGEMVRIYSIDSASRRDSVDDPIMGEISHAYVCVGEDYSRSQFAVTVKVKLDVLDVDLVLHLRDLANDIESRMGVSIEQALKDADDAAALDHLNRNDAGAK